MLKIIPLGVALFSAAVCTAALAERSDADCTAAWERADKDKNGVVSGSEVTPYLIALMKRKDIYYEHAKNGKLTQNEFMKACKDGAFESINLQVWEARRN
jgi:hypothetical protein